MGDSLRTCHTMPVSNNRRAWVWARLRCHGATRHPSRPISTVVWVSRKPVPRVFRHLLAHQRRLELRLQSGQAPLYRLLLHHFLHGPSPSHQSTELVLICVGDLYMKPLGVLILITLPMVLSNGPSHQSHGLSALLHLHPRTLKRRYLPVHPADAHPALRSLAVRHCLTRMTNQYCLQVAAV